MSKQTDNTGAKPAFTSGHSPTSGKVPAKHKCGIVMPISAIDGCAEQHWQDVKSILDDAITASGFEPSFVSKSDEVSVIQKQIVENLYENPIVVCDVSGRNPNVMLELGMRLAFDKPVVIVKDDKTAYSFDSSPIEHLVYPRDLRWTSINSFKVLLADKITATHLKATSDPNYSAFLKHFGQFTVAKIDSKEVSAETALLAEVREMREGLSILTDRIARLDRPANMNRHERMGGSASYPPSLIASVRDAVIKYIKSSPAARELAVRGRIHESTVEAIMSDIPELRSAPKYIQRDVFENAWGELLRSGEAPFS
jgi:hypothetical protein